VSYFAEFRDVIKREENAISHELVVMQDQLTDFNSLLEMLKSLETQCNIVVKMQSKPSAKEEMDKQLKVLHSEYKMYSMKKVKI